jgi:uncharacterized protein (DUF1800 family)
MVAPTPAPTAAVRTSAAAALTAAQRFGLGEAQLAPLASDPPGWLLQQIQPASPQPGAELASAAHSLRVHAELQRQRREAKRGEGEALEQKFNEQFRALMQADLRARLLTAATSTQGFNERLVLFWANHFTVSALKGPVRGLVGPFEREVVRPHIAGPFETLLNAAVRHPAMLRYLDNDQSAGPHARVALRRQRRAQDMETPTAKLGLNENLARELLELHTLGVAGGGAAYGGWGGYTQADVTALAALLTGWRVPVQAVLQGSDTTVAFDPDWHEPGPKTVLGKSYAEGPDALAAVLHDLARHPHTARFLAYKLARHVVADQPPPSLVRRLEKAYLQSEGHLGQMAAALVQAPEAWTAERSKLKTPEEFVLSSLRLLGAGPAAFQRAPDAGITALGQRLHATPSPAGWPDRAEDWLGPEAVWKRVEWATNAAQRAARQTDARRLADSAFGAALSEDTRRQIERAADGPQALALLLLSPEQQRR